MGAALRRTAAIALSAAAIATPLAAAAPASAAPSGTATWAELPKAAPSFIFPFMGLQQYNISNVNNFQHLMYRPLYWFGKGRSPDLNADLSLAKAPAYSDGSKRVTVELKGWRWSDGERVSARSVMFWMNLLHAEKEQWAQYIPEIGIPDELRSAKVTAPGTVTFELTAPVNARWFTANQLSQITPLPAAWDKTSDAGSPGSGGCSSAAYGTADKQCSAVYTYLARSSGFDPAAPKAANLQIASYASNPLWQVVDGPWRLKSMDALGNVEFVPNPRYSGPIKPSFARFVELPFASDADELQALEAGRLDVGYLPAGELGSGTKRAQVAGANSPKLKGRYSLDPLYTWSINYFPYNFNSNGAGGVAGKIFQQLYFRQAFQTLIDQPGYVRSIWKGYGLPTYGPIPSFPTSSFAPAGTSNPYPYSVSKARSLLSSHGWKVVPGKVSSCVRPGTGPGRCGAGIPAGAKLSFDLEYATGTSALSQLMVAEKASWAQAGIHVVLHGAPFTTVLNNAVPCPASQPCGWELENYGGGWYYSPDAYPSGELMFATGAGSNPGSYSSKEADRLIAATVHSSAGLDAYARYISTQLPVVFQPIPYAALTEVRRGLSGVTPQSPFFAITPEAWRR